MANIAAYKLLLIGHVCHDMFSKNKILLGGTAAYSSILASAMGMEVSLITSCGDDFLFAKELINEKLDLAIIPSTTTTTFHNIYKGNQRQQYLINRALDLSLPDIKPTLPDVVFFCPIADEVPFEMVSQFSESIKVATIQGWLRKWDTTGLIEYKSINWKNLVGMDLLIMSDEDLPHYQQEIKSILRYVSTVVVTRGELGAELYTAKKTWFFPSSPSKVKDPTGAGDSFAIGLVYQLLKSSDLIQSMVYAHVIASIIIQKNGVTIPTREQICQKLENYPYHQISSSEV